MKVINYVLFSSLLLTVPLAFAEPAVVINDGSCGFLTPDGNMEGVGMTVETHSSNSTVILICKGEVAPPESGKAIIYNFENTGYECYRSTDDSTKDWRQIISAKGEVTATCIFKSP